MRTRALAFGTRPGVGTAVSIRAAGGRAALPALAALPTSALGTGRACPTVGGALPPAPDIRTTSTGTALLAVPEETAFPTPVQRTGQHGRHGGDRLLSAHDLDPAGYRRLLLGRQHSQDGDAVDLDFRLDPDDVADFRARRQHRGGNRTLGLARTRGPPGERVVVSSARELYVHPV
jgi:hypothetical protein